MEVKMDLKSIQLLFKKLVTDFDLSHLPQGFFSAGTGHLSAEDRLTIYRKDFGGRFVEVLQEGYPNLQILLGEEEFGDLVERYTSKYPSRHYDLNQFGESLAVFLLSDPLIQQAPFLADLARAEWQIASTFQYGFLPPVDVSVLQHVREQDWQNACFEFQPSLSLLRSTWPLPALLHVQNMKEDEFDPDSICEQSSNYLLIAQRPDQGVDWHTIEEKEFRVLQSLLMGKKLGEVCDEFLNSDDTRRVQQWFTKWMTSGLVTRIY